MAATLASRKGKTAATPAYPTTGNAKVSEAARFMQVHVNTIRRWVRLDQIEHIKRGRVIRIPWQALHAMN